MKSCVVLNNGFMSYKKYFMGVNVSAQNKKASQKSEIAPAPKWLVKFCPILAKWTKWNTLKEKENFKALIVISVPYCDSNSGNAFVYCGQTAVPMLETAESIYDLCLLSPCSQSIFPVSKHVKHDFYYFKSLFFFLFLCQTRIE